MKSGALASLIYACGVSLRDSLLSTFLPKAPLQPGEVPWSALLSVQGADGQRATYPFRHPRVGIGRSRANDLALPDQAVSGYHCEFVDEGGYLVVRDLESGNGTFVNEKRVQKARLHDGDVVRAGETRIAIALSGNAKGSGRLTRQQLRRLWPWVAVVGVVLLAVCGAVLARAWALRSEQELRARYEQAVRDQVTPDPCRVPAPQLKALHEADARLGGRSVAMTLKRGQLAMTTQDLSTDAELLPIFREKAALVGQLVQQLVERQQTEREGLEKLSRLGARLADAKDRKVAFWADGQLADRLARGDAFVEAVRELRRQTDKLADLITAVLQRSDDTAALQLASFRFGEDLNSLVRSCGVDTGRATAGALGALDALDEE